MNQFKIIILGLALVSTSLFAQSVTGVNFVQEGEVSKLVIQLDKSSYAERKHIIEDKQIILDVKNTKAAQKFLRGIDTSEFSGSIVYISGYKKPGSENDLRFAIQLRDNVRSILDLGTNRITLNVENRFGVFSKARLKKADEKISQVNNDEETDEKINIPKSTDIEDILENLTMAGIKKYAGKRITLNVKAINVEAILNMIAETSGFNIIIEKGVDKAPPLTLNLTNIPWDQALDTVLSLSKLVAQKYGNILIIKTKEDALKEKENELKNKKQNLTLEPLVTKIFPISFAETSALEKILKDYLTEGRGKIQVDERTNNLIVKDTVEVIERMKKIISYLDTQTPQILIESKIVEVSETYSLRMGLGTGLNFEYDPIANSGDLQDNEGPGFAFSSSPGNGQETGNTFLSATIGIYNRMSNLNFDLQLMEAEAQGKVISSPKIITDNKKAATITSSESKSFPVTTTTAAGTTTAYSSIDASLSLAVTPQVTNEGSIAMSVSLSNGSFGASSQGQSGPPDTNTRNIETNVLVENGSTVVIGGLYKTESRNFNNGIPFLKDLPLIGWLFRSPLNESKSKSELMIFLTPRIINQEEAGLVDRGNEVSGD